MLSAYACPVYALYLLQTLNIQPPNVQSLTMPTNPDHQPMLLLPSPTKEQQLILDRKAPRKVVVAVPGSGKTSLLFMSIDRHIQSHSTPCLMLCYSRKVRHENQVKAKLWFPDNHRIAIHTLDSFCFSILLQHRELAGYEKRLSIDDTFSETLLQPLYDNCTIKSFVSYDTLLKVIKHSVMTTTLRNSLNKFDIDAEYYNAFKIIRIQYLNARRTKGLISYREQILACLMLFKKHPEILQSITDYYGLLLVDELQDLDKLKMNIAMSLTKGIKHSVFVGDDAQCIFKFAGAKENNFSRLFKLGHYFSLSQSHRCTTYVAELASIIRRHIKGVTKIHMWSDKEGDFIKLRGFRKEYMQYEYIAKQITKLNSNGVSLCDIVVLGHNHRSLQEVMKQLQFKGIPFEEKYSEQLRLADFDSDTSYATPFYQIVIDLILLFEYGYDEELVYKILIYFDIQTVDEAFSYVENELESTNKMGRKPTSNIQGLKLLGNLIAKACRSPSLESKVFLITEYISKRYRKTEKYSVASYLTQVNTLSKHGDNVEEFVSKLRDLCLGNNKECVSLRTIHVSKGLEYKHVFLVDADHTVFPDIRNNENDELKLFYVAITRSLMSLTICSVMNEELMLTQFLKYKGIKKLVDYRLV